MNIVTNLLTFVAVNGVLHTNDDALGCRTGPMPSFTSCSTTQQVEGLLRNPGHAVACDTDLLAKKPLRDQIGACTVERRTYASPSEPSPAQPSSKVRSECLRVSHERCTPATLDQVRAELATFE